MIDFDVISSGSKGNAVILDNKILIDCGVPFSALRNYHKALQLVLLTHRHSDHFNKTTLKMLARERPTLRFGCPVWLVAPLVDCCVQKNKIDIFDFDTGLCYGEGNGWNGLAIEAFPLVHDVPNCGYKIHFGDGRKALYATDTNSMEGVKAKNYDLYLLEANHDMEEMLDRIRTKQETGEYIYEYRAVNNHLSKEKSNDWLYQNMGPNSSYVYLHGHEE